MTRKILLCALAALALDISGQQAQASTLTASSSSGVLFSNLEAIQGSVASSTQFTIPSAGELFLTFTDLNFPSALSSIDFGILENGQTLQTQSGSGGTLEAYFSGPTTLYAQVFASSATSAWGAYNLTANFIASSPVPLPATGALLAAVTFLAGLLELTSRRRAQAIVTTAVA